MSGGHPLSADRNGMETIGMWISEYNEEETMQMFREEGRQEGLREGEKKGENLFASLVNKLLSSGRIEDVRKAADDVEFRERLYLQIGLKKSR